MRQNKLSSGPNRRSCSWTIVTVCLSMILNLILGWRFGGMDSEIGEKFVRLIEMIWAKSRSKRIKTQIFDNTEEMKLGTLAPALTRRRNDDCMLRASLRENKILFSSVTFCRIGLTMNITWIIFPSDQIKYEDTSTSMQVFYVLLSTTK